jgi:ankyrin repeat protein
MNDRNGRLPIHCAFSPWNGCNKPCDPTAIEILVDANPLTLKEKDHRDRLPLDFLFLERPKPGPAFLKAIVKMIDAYPDALLARKDDGKTPLHCACLANRWEVLQLVFDANPSALKIRDSNGTLPLHLACGSRRSSPMSVIGRMIDAYPDALLARKDDGQTPLHCACLANRWEVIQLLLDANPSAVKLSDRYGTLPLHLACKIRDSTNLSVIGRMIDAYPDAFLAKQDYDGRTPLHYACSAERWEVIQLLLDANPSAVKLNDCLGALPLHLACGSLSPSSAKLSVIGRMIDAYPDALRVRDRAGCTPVMTAIGQIQQRTTGVAHVCVRMIQRGGSASVRGVCRYTTPAWTWYLQYSHVLVRMIQRGGSASVRGVFRGDSSRMATALNHTLQYYPNLALVSALIETWPCSLCLPLPPLRFYVDVGALVRQESDAVIEALVEVLLHETTVGVVPDPIRASVRQLAATQPGSRPDTRAIQDLFGGDFEKAFFLSREDIQDMITGIYRMNKAARAAGAPAAVTPAQHIQVLAAAADNPSCLFVYLLNAGCRSLFAGYHGKSPREGRTESSSARERAVEPSCRPWIVDFLSGLYRRR